jgi:Tfp pilus assembly protein PilX
MNAFRFTKHRQRHMQDPTNARKIRRGAVLVVVLVCFTLCAFLFALVARHAMQARRGADKLLWTAQAHWVAEAALEKAAVRLAADANYPGETWTIPAAELSSKDGAVARIRVEKVANRPNRRLVQVEADYPDDPVHRARWTTQVEIDRPADPAKAAAEKPKDKKPTGEKP